ncbi:MAG: hypothetical protein K9G59_16985 [Caulobacter sp.]|nr:hypothetical protein [Caulobacter sp.]
MNISSAVRATATAAPRVESRAALKEAAEARAATVSEAATRARSGPRMAASESRKQQAKAKLQQVREWLKIVRKLYAQNPVGMAKTLAQVFKDLKAAVAAYRDAGGQAMGASGAAVAMPPAPPRPAGDEKAAGAGEGEKADGAATAGDGAVEKVGDAMPATRPSEGASLYAAVVDEVRKQLGEDGLDFLKEVRGMVDDIRKLLEAARGQAAIRRRDKDTDEAFEAADKALKDLNETMNDMERQIRHDAPSAGMTLSVAA